MTTPRRELTWQACDALARDGKKPSISSVREWTLMHHGLKRGSDTDTQADINAWYAELLASKQERIAVAGMPDAIAELARTLWLKACEAAAENLAKEREEICAQIVRAQEEVLAVRQQAKAASDQMEMTANQLAVVQEAVKRLEEALSESRTTAAVAQERHAGHLQQRDDRIAALLKELSRRDVEHAARVSDLESGRKHALLQMDEARQQTRVLRQDAERIAAEMYAASAAQHRHSTQLEAELGNATEKLSMAETRMKELADRSRMLEAHNLLLEERLLAKAEPKKNGLSAVRTFSRLGGVVRRRKL